jgi:hypothetical protein
MLVPSYSLIGDGDPKPEWGWVWDEFCTHDGYEYGYGDVSNMMGMGLGCYNPMGNYPLTSLVSRHTDNRSNSLKYLFLLLQKRKLYSLFLLSLFLSRRLGPIDVRLECLVLCLDVLNVLHIFWLCYVCIMSWTYQVFGKRYRDGSLIVLIGLICLHLRYSSADDPL